MKRLRSHLIPAIAAFGVLSSCVLGAVLIRSEWEARALKTELKRETEQLLRISKATSIVVDPQGHWIAKIPDGFFLVSGPSQVERTSSLGLPGSHFFLDYYPGGAWDIDSSPYEVTIVEADPNLSLASLYAPFSDSIYEKNYFRPFESLSINKEGDGSLEAHGYDIWVARKGNVVIEVRMQVGFLSGTENLLAKSFLQLVTEFKILE